MGARLKDGQRVMATKQTAKQKPRHVEPGDSRKSEVRTLKTMDVAHYLGTLK